VSPAGPQDSFFRGGRGARHCLSKQIRTSGGAGVTEGHLGPSGRALRERKRSTGWIFEPIRSSMPISNPD
jgi:hypothetical protein